MTDGTAETVLHPPLVAGAPTFLVSPSTSESGCCTEEDQPSAVTCGLVKGVVELAFGTDRNTEPQCPEPESLTLGSGGVRLFSFSEMTFPVDTQ